MTNRDQEIVKPGQVWADNDKRSGQRTLRVERLTEYLYSSGGLIGPVPYAVCTVLTDRSGKPVKSGRRVEIRVSRFRPTSTGYRLVSEAQS